MPANVQCDISGAAAALGGLSGCCCPLEKLNCLQLSSQCIHDAVNRAVTQRKRRNGRSWSRKSYRGQLSPENDKDMNEFSKLILNG